MGFESILYAGSGAPRLSEEPPGCFEDLGLDAVVSSIARRLHGAELVRRLWYTPPAEIEDARYRQEVFADLEEPRVLAALKRFEEELSGVLSALEYAEEYTSGRQREGIFLGAALSYIKAVNELLEFLRELPIQSRGLLGLRRYLENYTSSEKYRRLRDEAEDTASSLSSLRFCIDIKGGTITVYERCEGEDYTSFLEKLFERFSDEDEEGGGDAEPSWRLEYYRGHVEAAILELAARIHREPFSRLSRFYRENKGFIDPVIHRIYEELEFYLSYLDYISPLRRAGLPFTLPRLRPGEGEDYCIDCFDLGLASRLVAEGRRPVTNSFRMGPGEKIIVVTGPNSGGKTTFARMIGQVYYLAKLGVPVPGREAELLFVDAVYTHFPRGEDVENLRSKLEEDIMRIKEILDKATPRSLIVINELFSSTASYDAAQLGRRILEKIRSIGSRCVYVTFIDELARLSYVASYVAQVDPRNPAVRTYRVVKKPADGVTYARLIAKKYGLTYEDIVSRVKP